MFRVRMGTEMALGQDQNTRCAMGLKLVKGSANDCKAAPFSDSIHNFLKMGGSRDPYAIYVSH